MAGGDALSFDDVLEHRLELLAHVFQEDSRLHDRLRVLAHLSVHFRSLPQRVHPVFQQSVLLLHLGVFRPPAVLFGVLENCSGRKLARGELGRYWPDGRGGLGRGPFLPAFEVADVAVVLEPGLDVDFAVEGQRVRAVFPLLGVLVFSCFLCREPRLLLFFFFFFFFISASPAPAACSSSSSSSSASLPASGFSGLGVCGTSLSFSINYRRAAQRIIIRACRTSLRKSTAIQKTRGRLR